MLRGHAPSPAVETCRCVRCVVGGWWSKSAAAVATSVAVAAADAAGEGEERGVKFIIVLTFCIQHI